MSKDLSVEEAAAIIASAFSPMRCIAKPDDYGAKFKFRVFDTSEESVLKVEDLAQSQVTDRKRLELIINSARANLTGRKFSLDPWEFPDG